MFYKEYWKHKMYYNYIHVFKICFFEHFIDTKDIKVNTQKKLDFWDSNKFCACAVVFLEDEIKISFIKELIIRLRIKCISFIKELF